MTVVDASYQISSVLSLISNHNQDCLAIIDNYAKYGQDIHEPLPVPLNIHGILYPAGTTALLEACRVGNLEVIHHILITYHDQLDLSILHPVTQQTCLSLLLSHHLCVIDSAQPDNAWIPRFPVEFHQLLQGDPLFTPPAGYNPRLLVKCVTALLALGCPVAHLDVHGYSALDHMLSTYVPFNKYHIYLFLLLVSWEIKQDWHGDVAAAFGGTGKRQINAPNGLKLIHRSDRPPLQALPRPWFDYRILHALVRFEKEIRSELPDVNRVSPPTAPSNHQQTGEDEVSGAISPQNHDKTDIPGITPNAAIDIIGESFTRLKSLFPHLPIMLPPQLAHSLASPPVAPAADPAEGSVTAPPAAAPHQNHSQATYQIRQPNALFHVINNRYQAPSSLYFQILVWYCVKLGCPCSDIYMVEPIPPHAVFNADHPPDTLSVNPAADDPPEMRLNSDPYDINGFGDVHTYGQPVDSSSFDPFPRPFFLTRPDSSSLDCITILFSGGLLPPLSSDWPQWSSVGLTAELTELTANITHATSPPHVQLVDVLLQKMTMASLQDSDTESDDKHQPKSTPDDESLPNASQHASAQNRLVSDAATADPHHTAGLTQVNQQSMVCPSDGSDTDTSQWLQIHPSLMPQSMWKQSIVPPSLYDICIVDLQRAGVDNPLHTFLSCVDTVTCNMTQICEFFLDIDSYIESHPDAIHQNPVSMSITSIRKSRLVADTPSVPSVGVSRIPTYLFPRYALVLVPWTALPLPPATGDRMISHPPRNTEIIRLSKAFADMKSLESLGQQEDDSSTKKRRKSTPRVAPFTPMMPASEEELEVLMLSERIMTQFHTNSPIVNAYWLQYHHYYNTHFVYKPTAHFTTLELFLTYYMEPFHLLAPLYLTPSGSAPAGSTPVTGSFGCPPIECPQHNRDVYSFLTWLIVSKHQLDVLTNPSSSPVESSVLASNYSLSTYSFSLIVQLLSARFPSLPVIRFLFKVLPIDRQMALDLRYLPLVIPLGRLVDMAQQAESCFSSLPELFSTFCFELPTYMYQEYPHRKRNTLSRELPTQLKLIPLHILFLFSVHLPAHLVSQGLSIVLDEASPYLDDSAAGTQFAFLAPLTPTVEEAQALAKVKVKKLTPSVLPLSLDSDDSSDIGRSFFTHNFLFQTHRNHTQKRRPAGAYVPPYLSCNSSHLPHDVVQVMLFLSFKRNIISTKYRRKRKFSLKFWKSSLFWNSDKKYDFRRKISFDTAYLKSLFYSWYPSYSVLQSDFYCNGQFTLFSSDPLMKKGMGKQTWHFYHQLVNRFYRNITHLIVQGALHPTANDLEIHGNPKMKTKRPPIFPNMATAVLFLGEYRVLEIPSAAMYSVFPAAGSRQPSLLPLPQAEADTAGIAEESMIDGHNNLSGGDIPTTAKTLKESDDDYYDHYSAPPQDDIAEGDIAINHDKTDMKETLNKHIDLPNYDAVISPKDAPSLPSNAYHAQHSAALRSMMLVPLTVTSDVNQSPCIDGTKPGKIPYTHHCLVAASWKHTTFLPSPIISLLGALFDHPSGLSASFVEMYDVFPLLFSLVKMVGFNMWSFNGILMLHYVLELFKGQTSLAQSSAPHLAQYLITYITSPELMPVEFTDAFTPRFALKMPGVDNSALVINQSNVIFKEYFFPPKKEVFFNRFFWHFVIPQDIYSDPYFTSSVLGVVLRSISGYDLFGFDILFAESFYATLDGGSRPQIIQYYNTNMSTQASMPARMFTETFLTRLTDDKQPLIAPTDFFEKLTPSTEEFTVFVARMASHLEAQEQFHADTTPNWSPFQPKHRISITPHLIACFHALHSLFPRIKFHLTHLANMRYHYYTCHLLFSFACLLYACPDYYYHELLKWAFYDYYQVTLLSTIPVAADFQSSLPLHYRQPHAKTLDNLPKQNNKSSDILSIEQCWRYPDFPKKPSELRDDINAVRRTIYYAEDYTPHTFYILCTLFQFTDLIIPEVYIRPTRHNSFSSPCPSSQFYLTTASKLKDLERMKSTDERSPDDPPAYTAVRTDILRPDVVSRVLENDSSRTCSRTIHPLLVLPRFFSDEDMHEYISQLEHNMQQQIEKGQMPLLPPRHSSTLGTNFYNKLYSYLISCITQHQSLVMSMGQYSSIRDLTPESTQGCVNYDESHPHYYNSNITDSVGSTCAGAFTAYQYRSIRGLCYQGVYFYRAPRESSWAPRSGQPSLLDILFQSVYINPMGTISYSLGYGKKLDADTPIRSGVMVSPLFGRTTSTHITSGHLEYFNDDFVRIFDIFLRYCGVNPQIPHFTSPQMETTMAWTKNVLFRHFLANLIAGDYGHIMYFRPEHSGTSTSTTRRLGRDVNPVIENSSLLSLHPNIVTIACMFLASGATTKYSQVFTYRSSHSELTHGSDGDPLSYDASRTSSFKTVSTTQKEARQLSLFQNTLKPLFQRSRFKLSSDQLELYQYLVDCIQLYEDFTPPLAFNYGFTSTMEALVHHPNINVRKTLFGEHHASLDPRVLRTLTLRQFLYPEPPLSQHAFISQLHGHVVDPLTGLTELHSYPNVTYVDYVSPNLCDVEYADLRNQSKRYPTTTTSTASDSPSDVNPEYTKAYSEDSKVTRSAARGSQDDRSFGIIWYLLQYHEPTMDDLLVLLERPDVPFDSTNSNGQTVLQMAILRRWSQEKLLAILKHSPDPVSEVFRKDNNGLSLQQYTQRCLTHVHAPELTDFVEEVIRKAYKNLNLS